VKVSSHDVEHSSHDVEHSSHDVEHSSHDVEHSSHDVKESSQHLKESSQHLKESSQHLKESSQRRFQLKLARSGSREAVERILHPRREEAAHVEGKLASSFRLKPVVSRAEGDGFGRKEDVE
jgi:hypothetical protein